MENEDNLLQSFLLWASDLGVTDSTSFCMPSSSGPQPCLGQSLVVSQFPDAGGRGLAAVREIKRGEMILRVPKDALLTRSCLLQDDRAAQFLKRSPNLSSTQVLVVALLAEAGKRKESRWAPYLAQLPRTYCTLSYFTHFEIEALQVEEASWVARKALLKARSDWEEALSFMHEVGLGCQLKTFRSWLWASATVSSRSLHIPWDNAGCLCPVGDLFNYTACDESISSEDSTRSTMDLQNPLSLIDARYEEEQSAYCFFARKNYKKGEQVLLCYGAYTNLELLEHYGFLLDDNPSDKAFIEVEPNIQFSCPWPLESLYIQCDGKPSFALMCALRLWSVPHSSTKALRRLVFSGSVLSIENERLVMQWLINCCSNLLNSFPTKVEDDLALLLSLNQMVQSSRLSRDFVSVNCQSMLMEFFQTQGLMDRDYLTVKAQRVLEKWRLAVRWRLSYKRSLLSCVVYCKGRIDRLNCNGMQTIMHSSD